MAINPVPVGLEILSQLGQVECHQVGSTGQASTNQYVITNHLGQQIFQVTEEGDFWTSCCAGSDRAFMLTVTDTTGRVTMRISRDESGSSCSCCPDQMVTVVSPTGQIIGRVRQMPSCGLDEFQIESATGEPQLFLQVDSFNHGCCQDDLTYPILCPTGEQIGNVTEFWSGWQREYSHAHDFRVEFPADLDVNVKATLIGAMFLLDFRMSSDESARRRRSRH